MRVKKQFARHSPSAALYRFGSRLRQAYRDLVPGPQFLAQNRRFASYQIGEWTYGYPEVLSWGEGAQLSIGRFCSIAQGVTVLLGGEHRADFVTTYPFSALIAGAEPYGATSRAKGDVVIGHDVWIGEGALVRSGVVIGNGAVIAARSVVARDVAPYSIVGGNPARHIRFRFSPEVIDALQRIAWWDWPPSRIEEAWPLLLSAHVAAFVARYDRAADEAQR